MSEPKRMLIREIDDCYNCPTSDMNKRHIVSFCPEAGVSEAEWQAWQDQYTDQDTGEILVPAFHPKCPLPIVATKRLLIREIAGCHDCPIESNARCIYNGLARFCPEIPETVVSKEEWYEWQDQHTDQETGKIKFPAFHPKCPLPKITADPEGE